MAYKVELVSLGVIPHWVLYDVVGTETDNVIGQINADISNTEAELWKDDHRNTRLVCQKN